MPFDSRSHTLASLAAELDKTEIADRARKAGLRFVNAATTWEKPELAGWLIGPYYSATSLVARSPRSSARVVRVDGVETGTLESVLTESRLRVLSTLESCAIARDPIAFARPLAARGLVIPIFDRAGEPAWMPVDVPRTRLTERVLALFAADALTRSADFESGLVVCHRCELVRIDPEARDVACPCERRVD